MSDFEKSELKALRQVFPSAITSGCLFHWSQRLYKKVRSLGIDRMFHDEEIGKNARETFRLNKKIKVEKYFIAKECFVACIDPR